LFVLLVLLVLLACLSTWAMGCIVKAYCRHNRLIFACIVWIIELLNCLFVLFALLYWLLELLYCLVFALIIVLLNCLFALIELNFVCVLYCLFVYCIACLFVKIVYTVFLLVVCHSTQAQWVDWSSMPSHTRLPELLAALRQAQHLKVSNKARRCRDLIVIVIVDC